MLPYSNQYRKSTNIQTRNIGVYPCSSVVYAFLKNHTNRLLGYILVLVCLAGLPLIQTNAQSSASIEIVSASFRNFPDYTIYFRVRDTSGKDILEGVQPGNIKVIEDGTPVFAELDIQQHKVDASKPEQAIRIESSDAYTYTLYTTGATIGVVFDATTLLNAQATGVDYVQSGRDMIETFLLNTGGQATIDPEAISLFIPTDNPAQHMQPDEFVAFTQDRNAVVNYLRAMPPRTGATTLYAAVQKAVQQTADKARQRGSHAIVLVVSDGGDNLSGESFNEIVRIATEQQVKIVTFGLKPDETGTKNFQLAKLADLTDGVYKATPDVATINEVFTQTVQAMPATLYALKYQTNLVEDGTQHTLALQIVLPDGHIVTSEDIPFVPGGNHESQPILPAGVALQRYLLFAVPIAALIPALFIGITRMWRGNLSQVVTRHDTKIS